MYDEIKFICNMCNKEKIWNRGMWSFTRIKHHKCNECKPIKSNRKENKICKKAIERARKKGLDLDIKPSDILIPEFCPVLGIKININNKTACYDSPSIDRINPNLGYIKGNIRIISNRANMLKNNATVEEMELILKDLKKIYNIGEVNETT